MPDCSHLFQYLTSLAKKYGKKVIARPESQKYQYYHDIYLITMNRTIASMATHVNPINDTSMRIIGNKLQMELRTEGIFIPWMETESYFFYDNQVITFPCILPKQEKKFTNVGATIATFLALLTAAEVPLSDTVKIAHLAGSITASKNQDEIISLEELERVLHTSN